MIQEKSPCPERARTLLRGTTLHLYSAKGHTGNQKAPVHSGTGARSRYHPALYFNGYSVTGTSVQTYYLRPGSSRVIDHGYVAPVFTIHRLSEASNFRFPLVHSMYLFELDCKYTGWSCICQMGFLLKVRLMKEISGVAGVMAASTRSFDANLICSDVGYRTSVVSRRSG